MTIGHNPYFPCLAGFLLHRISGSVKTIFPARPAIMHPSEITI
ncbi:MAG: hypothetical protein ACKO85_18975 [Isosphaeraceae bacterium]